MKVSPKKHLGQHFLGDESYCRKIAALVPANGGALLEIGPGMGALTRFLPLEGYEKAVLVELDSESVAYLNTHKIVASAQVVEADFLKMDLGQWLGPGSVVCGNFPYNISSQIFFKVLDHVDSVSGMVCMLQKEVAKRLASGPGTRDYGILSVLLQAYYDIKYEFTVPPGAFIPPPKVDSGVITLKRNSRAELGVPKAFFIKVVKAAFNQRRKTLRNALSGFSVAKIDAATLGKRAEQLSVNDFIALSTELLQDA